METLSKKDSEVNSKSAPAVESQKTDDETEFDENNYLPWREGK